ncbi:Oidioi.mRNA.OKI2018_I69.XSR.g14124.t1.cds [Oikopleura dioica]|uniref:Oidioi.mRNA.OKI2018_I69.XSR.g14124.t1.cds n=1 Tax=Oikopleura dioica TaxID=34765 RepID=A0ABN7SG51_OIKDI|nr:Oidioi.mRNA.OKI2018_I69.XSR.g14124.t1.cds [Oikopleura dioica]
MGYENTVPEILEDELTDEEVFKNYHHEALKRQNFLRENHRDTPALALSKELCISAEKSARKYCNDRTADYQTGQSVAFFARRVSETELEEDKQDCAVLACHRWYDQIVAYLEVWSETKEVGFGVAHDSDKGIVVVAKYLPQGNSENQYDLKVMLPERPWKEIKEEEIKMNEKKTSARRERVKELNKDEQFEGYQLDALSRHNALRQRHCDTYNLELSRRLCQEAQQEATSRIQSLSSSSPENLPFEESISSSDGTNYRVCAIPDPDDKEEDPEESKLKILTRETIFEWYSQLQNYLKSLDAKKYPDRSKFNSWCCFTQLVWRQSYEFGFAIQYDNENRAHIVAKYRSHGNVSNCYLENVGLPKVPQRSKSTSKAE